MVVAAHGIWDAERIGLGTWQNLQRHAPSEPTSPNWAPLPNDSKTF